MVAEIIPVIEVLVTGAALDAKCPSAHSAWVDESPHGIFLLSGELRSDVEDAYG